MSRDVQGPSSTGATARGGSHVSALDGIRGLAILCVLAFHFVVEVAPGGSVGVDLFFTLSAFLITSLMLREHTVTGRIDRPAFYWRRAARLLPALAVFLLLEAPLVAAALGTGAHVWSSTGVVLAYLADVAMAGYLPISAPYEHTWSLAVEEQFYLVWPTVLVLLLARGVRLGRTAGVLWLLGAAASAVVTWTVSGPADYFLPTGHLVSLAAGVGAAVAAHHVREATAAGTPVRAWWAHPAWGVAGVATVAVMAAAPRASWSPVAQAAMNDTASVLAGVLVLHAATARSPVTSALSVAPLRWLGTRSYGIYLYHVPLYLLFAAPHVDLSRSANALVAVALSLTVAELSFRALERPIMRWSRTWTRRPGRRPPVPVSAAGLAH